MLKILIGADVVPTKSNLKLFKNGTAEELVGKELLDILKQADYRICNLEVPLFDKEAPIKKCGPNLIAPTSVIVGYQALNINLVTLANNHIMDQGIQGLNSTINVLKNANVAYVGAGKNLLQASKPYIIDKNGIKVGIYACAEHEFSIAEDDYPGANPYEPLDSFDHVKNLKKECDYVIVLYHGGKEHYRYPSPYLQRIFRKFADVGADYVIAQHSHCVGCEEIYNSSHLLYGQGNFIFDNADNEYWNNALLLTIEFDKQNKSTINYIPIEKVGAVIRLSKDRSIIEDFHDRSRQILDKQFIKNQYTQFAQSMSRDYFYRLSGKISRFFLIRVINKLTNYKLLEWLYGQQEKLNIENSINCEAHRELLIEGMKVKWKQKQI